ncbi:radical SAM protein [Flavobacteriaceae sp. LMIT009]
MICEPLELEYVAANLGRHELKIFDHLVEKGFKKVFTAFDPDVVISSCYKTGTNEVIKIFRMIKELKDSCLTMVGGVHATLVPTDFADVSVDIIGIGDGTTLMPEIIDAFEFGYPIRDIPGLAIPYEEGKVYKTRNRPYMVKPDTLPFPNRDLVAHLRHKYYYLMHRPVATMKTTWGCWYRCNFCFTWKITDGMPYSRSPKSIVEELLTIESDEIYIVDDIFLINKSRLNELSRLIQENDIKKNYLCYARADFIAENEDIIAHWAQLGLKAVFIGLEATTDEELVNMNKQLPANDNIKAIEILRKHKIDTYGSLIPRPDYTKKDWKRLMEFIKTNKLYYVNISPATPLPGADDYDQYKDQLTVPEDAHSLFDLSHQLSPTSVSLRTYYWELLKIYAKTTLNMKSARVNTFRTLPSILSMDYWRLILGALKIGRQFLSSYSHHSQKEIRKSRYKGILPKDLTFDQKFELKSFKSFKVASEKEYESLEVQIQ